LWNHTKKFHNNENNISNLESYLHNYKNYYNCKYCSKSFIYKQSRSRHENIYCKNKNKLEINENKKNLENDKIKLEILKKEENIIKLKLKLENSNKIENITLKKLNKKLLERNNIIKNNNINFNVQNIVNNIQLVGFGKEEIVDMLSFKEKKLIMNSRYKCLEKLIEIIHCGKYNQFKNIIITNMKDQYMYKYDDKHGIFILSPKTDVLNSLINYRLDDLEVIYNDLLENNKLDEKTKDIIEIFINKINYSDSKFIDSEGKEYNNYKQYKINEVKILLYNNQDKTTNDISLLLSANEIIVNSDIKYICNV
jgi:hypothetical protein